MTIWQFFRELRETPRTWYISLYDPCIRDKSARCPVTAVGYSHGCFTLCAWDVAAKAIGLNIVTAKAIADGADGNYLGEGRPGLRRRLERACGVTCR